jgi:predicted RNase H-like HicB family nuclease
MGGFAFGDYVDAAMADASYEQVADGSFAGEITSCVGVVALAASRAECERELRSVLEGWVLLGLQLGHRLSVLQRKRL